LYAGLAERARQARRGRGSELGIRNDEFGIMITDRASKRAWKKYEVGSRSASQPRTSNLQLFDVRL